MNKLDIYFILVMCFINVTCGITLDPVKTSLSVENPISGSGQNNDPNNINNNLNIINRNEDLRKGETRYDDPPPEYYKLREFLKYFLFKQQMGHSSTFCFSFFHRTKIF